MHVWEGKVLMAEYPSPLLVGCSDDLCLLMKTGTLVSGCLKLLFPAVGYCNLLFAK